MGSINDLPSEVLTIIFSHFIKSEGHKSFLWNVATVCKYWNELSLKASIWKDVDASGWKTEELLKLCDKGLLTSTRSLRLNDRLHNFESDVHDLSGIIVHCENLRQLNLHNLKLSEFSLRNLAKACPRLDSFTIHNVDFQGENSIRDFLFPIDPISPILSTCGKKLKHLHLGDVRKLMWPFYKRDNRTSCLISDIAHFCSSLEEMVFDWGWNYYNIVYPFPLDLIGKGCPRLRTLKLSYCAITFSNVVGQRWFVEMMSFSAKYCDFQSLDLYMLFKHSGNLKKLNIKRCKNTVLDDMSMISPNKLETLIIENMSFECLRFLEDAFGKWKRTLKEIRLCGLKHDVTSVLESFLNENQHPVIERLSLINVVVSDTCLVTFIRACRGLMNFNLVPYRSWNKLPLVELEISCNKLRTLRLCNCQMIFPNSKDKYNFKEIKSFVVGKCDFGGIGLHTLLSYSTDLEKLCIRNCSNIELNGMSMIVSNKLKVLKIENTFCGSSFEFLEDALTKWKRTLKVLHLCGLKHDMTSVMESFLYENHHPVIQTLRLRNLSLSIQVFGSLQKACKKLSLNYNRTVVLFFGS